MTTRIPYFIRHCTRTCSMLQMMAAFAKLAPMVRACARPEILAIVGAFQPHTPQQRMATRTLVQGPGRSIVTATLGTGLV
jgi:hypothetical protein